MPTVTATVGSASANSYVTDTEADTYFDERINADAWNDEGTQATKDRALITATRRIDQEWFLGEKASSGQALKWPRIWAYDEDGEEYSASIIPQIVKDATFEMALYLLNKGSSDPLQDTGLEEFERAKVGELDVTRKPGYRAGKLPETVRRILKPVLATPSGNSVQLWATGNSDANSNSRWPTL